MAKVAPIQTNFNTGEISPLLEGRVDFDKYKAALKTCLNHLPLVQGGTTRRPGTVFVSEVKDSAAKTRIVKFEYSVTQAYILEFGNLYVRIYYAHGRAESPPGTAVEVTTPYTTAQIPDLMFTQSADTLYIAHPSHPPAAITRASHTSWSYTVQTFLDGPYLNQNATTTTLTFSSGAAGTGITCTASAVTGINNGTGFQSTDVGRHIRAQMPGGAWGWAKITGRTSTTVVTVTIIEPFIVTTNLTTTSITSDFATVVNPDGIFVGNTITSTNVTAGTTVIAVAGSKIQMSAVASAVSTASATFGGTSLATTVWRLGLWSETTGYPAAVTFYQDRLAWGGCTAIPESVQLSETGNYLSHRPTEYDTEGTVIDSHAMNITLASNDVQYVRWISGDTGGLLVGTSSGEWTIAPSSLGGALTPTNINAVQMAAFGSAKIRAVKVGNTTLMVQRSGRKVRELTYVYYENKYHAPDMTVLAQHITRGGITEAAYQQEPHSILWSVRGDGVLLGFTYERDQQVIGWHRHTLGGTDVVVESVATIPAPDGTRDEVWLVVKRTIDGSTKRYVEYMTKVWERGDVQATCVFADCALQYDGAATDAVSGLDHLEGETVCVLADGALHPDRTVASGAIALNREATKITVGLRYNSDAQTLRLEAGAANGTAQGKTQRSHRVTFRLYEALGISVGPDFDHLTPRIVRTSADDMGAAVPLFSGDDSDTWDGDYSLENLHCWRFSDPLPGTVLAIMPQLATQDR